MTTTEEVWNLNGRKYCVNHGKAQDFGYGSQMIFRPKYHYVAQQFDLSTKNLIRVFEIQIMKSSSWNESIFDELILRPIAITKIKRFLIGDEKRWKIENDTIFVLQIPLSECHAAEDFKISEEKSMTIEWSQIIEGKQADGTYIVDEVGEVFVGDDDIERAAKLGGNPSVELSDATAADSYISQFVISRFIPRSIDAQRLAARENKRLLGLRQVFESSNASTQSLVSWPEIIAAQRWSEEEANDVLFFLRDRGLIEIKRFGPIVSLTRAGLDEMEEALRLPRRRTDNFSSTTVQYINNMATDNSINISGGNIGAVQSGVGANANVQQNIGANSEELVQIFKQLREEVKGLPEVKRIEAEAIITDIEEEAQSDSPKPHRLKAFGSALWEIASSVLTAASTAYLKAQMGVG